MFRNLKITRGDFFGGLTAGIVALPLALAFGVQSGMGATAGLYGAIFLGFFAALLGGTPSQISGPTGPMTVITAATVTSFLAASGSLEASLGAIMACFILAGILQVVMGIFRIGSLIKYIPYPVISGFMSGIGVIIILLQLFPALGLPAPANTLDVVRAVTSITEIHPWALLYSTLTIIIIYFFPKITGKIPSTLVALLAVTLLSVALDRDVPVIGDIPKGFPELKISRLLSIDPGLYTLIVETALTLAALGAIDSLLTSVIADNVTKTKHNSNRELIGQGIGNSIGGLFAGIPGAGATMRTLVNIRSGGRNRTSGMIHSLVLLAILLGAGSYAALIPKSVLAGILITVGIGILDYKGLRHIARVPRADSSIMLIVLLATVFLDLILAVAIGMVMASILFMKKMSDITSAKTKITELNPLLSSDSNGFSIPAEIRDKIIVKEIEGPLFFGFASNFEDGIARLKEIKYVIIRMEKVPFMDQTGLYALENSILELERKGIDVLITGLQEQPEAMLRRIKIIPELINETHLFAGFDESIDWLANRFRIVHQ